MKKIIVSDKKTNKDLFSLTLFDNKGYKKLFKALSKKFNVLEVKE